MPSLTVDKRATHTVEWNLVAMMSQDDPIVKIADMLAEPEARMWQEALSRKGIHSVVKSATGDLGGGVYTQTDYSVWTRQSQADDALAVIRGQSR